MLIIKNISFSLKIYKYLKENDIENSYIIELCILKLILKTILKVSALISGNFFLFYLEISFYNPYVLNLFFLVKNYFILKMDLVLNIFIIVYCIIIY